MDEVYLNGQRIGGTGKIDDNPDHIHINDKDWQKKKKSFFDFIFD